MFENLDTLVPFLEEPNRKFHLREYAKVMRISPSTATNHLGLLVRQGLLVKKADRVYSIFKANLDSPKFRYYKLFFTVKRVMESGLLDFLDKELAFPTVIMFGSCAKGEDIKGSDLDLFVLTNTAKELDLKGFEKKLKRRIQLFVKSDKEFKEATVKSPELINNIINGIKLSGFLKVF